MRRVRDILGLLMVGDGILMALVPERRMDRWKSGPGWWRSFVREFAERPILTRLLGALTAVVGVAIAVPRAR